MRPSADLLQTLQDLNEVGAYICNTYSPYASATGGSTNNFTNTAALEQAMKDYTELKNSQDIQKLTSLKNDFEEALKNGIGNGEPQNKIREPQQQLTAWSAPLIGATPLFRAIQNIAQPNMLKYIQILVKLGVDLNESYEMKTPLELAISQGNANIVQLLLNHGANLQSAPGNEEYSLFQRAAAQGDPIILRLLLQKAQETGQMNQNSLNQALHTAVSNGFTGAVEVLIQYNANFNIQNESGKTPLCVAAKNGDLATVEVLINKGADLKIADSAGNTPLHYAAIANKDAAGRKPVQSRTMTLNFYKMDEPMAPSTPTIPQKPKEYQKIAEQLIAAGAENVENERGQTPLALALEYNEEQNDFIEVFTHAPDRAQNNNNQDNRF